MLVAPHLCRVPDHDALARRHAPLLADVQQRRGRRLVGERALAGDGRLKGRHGEVVGVEVLDAAADLQKRVVRARRGDARRGYGGSQSSRAPLPRCRGALGRRLRRGRARERRPAAGARRGCAAGRLRCAAHVAGYEAAGHARRVEQVTELLQPRHDLRWQSIRGRGGWRASRGKQGDGPGTGPEVPEMHGCARRANGHRQPSPLPPPNAQRVGGGWV